MEEIWAPVKYRVVYPKYEVSTLGRVRHVGGEPIGCWRSNPSKPLRFSIRGKQGVSGLTVDRVVWETFVGASGKNDAMVERTPIGHLDHDPTNCSIDNLSLRGIPAKSRLHHRVRIAYLSLNEDVVIAEHIGLDHELVFEELRKTLFAEKYRYERSVPDAFGVVHWYTAIVKSPLKWAYRGSEPERCTPARPRLSEALTTPLVPSEALLSE